MSAPTSAGAPDTVFNAPPGWQTPAGFDPRRGHPVDPTWPAAPAGWQFWVPRPGSRGPVAALKRGWWGPVLGGVVVLVLVAIATFSGPSSPTDGIGSCWARGSNDQFASVDCSSSRATYRVSAVVAQARSCPSTSPGYFESTSGIECLAAIP